MSSNAIRYEQGFLFRWNKTFIMLPLVDYAKITIAFTFFEMRALYSLRAYALLKTEGERGRGEREEGERGASSGISFSLMHRKLRSGLCINRHFLLPYYVSLL